MEGTRLTVVKLGKKEPGSEDEGGGGGGTEIDGVNPKVCLNGTTTTSGTSPGRAGQGSCSSATMRSSASEESQPDAYEFSIRTPVTPARWIDYDTVSV